MERVIASFGSAGLYCYDFAGKELWHRDFGKMNHMFGSASSVILYGDLCILPFSPDEKARLIAVNKLTGQTAWEVEPPKVDPSEQKSFEGPGPAGGPGRPGSQVVLVRRVVRAGPVWGLVPAVLPAAQEDRGDPGVVDPPLARGVRRSS